MVMILNIFIIVLNSCSLLRKDKYGCPNDARGMTEDQINAKANRKSTKAALSCNLLITNRFTTLYKTIFYVLQPKNTQRRY